MYTYYGNCLVVVEAEKSHNVLPASWRTRKAGGVIQFKSEGLRTEGPLV